MIRLKNQNSHGVVEYTITELEDISNLPKKSIATGSTAEGIISGKLVVYYFTENNGDNEGKWDKIA